MNRTRQLIIVALAAFYILTIAACANRGAGPQGGPKDEIPPAVVKYAPADGSVNMKRTKIEITFDEIVVLQNAYQKIIVSPPQRVPADIKAVGRKIQINFIDSLIDSTTYTIDFADAIVDNNEGNKLESFTYSFSTGDALDSMVFSGRVLNAANLNPIKELYVGLHTDLNDSAFLKTPFRRITKTDDHGHFTIINAPHGRYHLFALGDQGGDYIKNMPGEIIAFADTVYQPTRETSVRLDTVRNAQDSTIIDTVIVHKTSVTTPNDIVLLAFAEADHRQYLLKAERPDRHRLRLSFNSPLDSLPALRPVNFADSLFRPRIVTNEKRDTITYWLPDTMLWSRDTLQATLSYTRIDQDTTYQTNDTITFAFRAPKKPATPPRRSGNKQGKAMEKDKPTNPKIISSNASSTFDIYRPLELRFAMPTDMRQSRNVSYRLETKVDTTWKAVHNVRLERQDSVGTLYRIAYNWKPETSYRLTLDSALFLNMINQTNDSETIQLTTKSLEQYSKLILHLANNTGREVVELLDAKDKPVRTIALADTTGTRHDVTFEYITPGTYYLRLFSDDNGDGIWTPGSYAEHRQAEQVVYFPYDIELRAFWDVEEDWDITATPLTRQKPKELIEAAEKNGSGDNGGMFK